MSPTPISVLVVDAVRTPFLKSFGAFEEETPVGLSARVASELINRQGLSAAVLDEVVWGTVIGELAHHNLARDLLIQAGMPTSISASTVSKACVSSFRALQNCADGIALGRNHLALCGGVEVMSRVPLLFKESARKFFTRLAREKGGMKKLAHALRSFRPGMLLPASVALTESSTGLSMGDHAEIMATLNSISRAEQDAWTVRSHRLAHRARELGYLKDEVLPIASKKGMVSQDNLVRADATAESLATLKPAFDRRHGTLTAANSSALTDGAAGVLLASEQFAKSHGLEALGRVVGFASSAVDPADQLLLGPAYAIPKLLRQHGLTQEDVGVFEVHEAFASQLLSCQKSWSDEVFCREKLGLSSPFGAIPEERLNIDGGSLAYGHPLAATGARIVGRALRIARRTQSRFAVASACAAGGLADAILLEAFP